MVVCLGLRREHEHLYVAEVGLQGELAPRFVNVQIKEGYVNGTLVKAASLERRVDYEFLHCVPVRVELYKLVAAATQGVEHNFPRSLGPTPEFPLTPDTF